MKRWRVPAAASLPAVLGGCAAAGAVMGGVGTLVQLILYLAIIATPIALAVWLYNKE